MSRISNCANWSLLSNAHKVLRSSSQTWLIWVSPPAKWWTQLSTRGNRRTQYQREDDGFTNRAVFQQNDMELTFVSAVDERSWMWWNQEKGISFQNFEHIKNEVSNLNEQGFEVCAHRTILRANMELDVLSKAGFWFADQSLKWTFLRRIRWFAHQNLSDCRTF
jgi:hypothetical protein